ncbi:MAG: flagellar hook basal-body protein [Phycisphaerales bacterium]|nr:flagellar hook basal-body protein [Phycisphaerales bacterium]
MIYGMYLSASAAQANMLRQDVLSNNLANVNTSGFKPDRVAFRARDVARVEDALPLPGGALLERLGGGVMPVAVRPDLSPEPVETTGNPADLAIDGAGFFMVRDTRAGSGPDATRLTRDGRFLVGPDGRMVMATTGLPILDESGSPIRVERGLPIEVSDDGTVRQRGQRVATLAFVQPAEAERLIKAGDGLFRLPDGASPAGPAPAGRILQGHVEKSGTDAIRAMIDVTSASRAVESNLRMIGTFAEVAQRAIGALGRAS